MSVHQLARVMGHVDHGKTTSWIPFVTRVATGRQVVSLSISVPANRENGKKDHLPWYTRTRSLYFYARVRVVPSTDTILVVAADDGGYASRLWSHQPLKTANVPIIVAINKIDKPGTYQPERYRWIGRAWGYVNSRVEILNLLKSQLNSTKISKIVGNSPSCSWKSKNSKQTQRSACYRYGYRSALG